MKQKNLLLLPLFFLLCAISLAQNGNTRELTGRVVEIKNGEAIGISKITVSIVDFAYDVTNGEGYFRIPLPPDRDHVSIVLENTPGRMVSPYMGVVNLPPGHDFQIVVCGEENQRLADKLNKLNGSIRKLEKEKKLSARQLQVMHQTLLDTILHFERIIGGLNKALQQSGAENTVLSAEIAARDARIRELEESEKRLIDALGKALEDKFLRQKQHFEAISEDLMTYTDRLRDLRDRCSPSQLPYPFRSPEASEQLGKKINAYNDVRNAIVKNHHVNNLAVREYWEDPAVADLLESTYDYLLKEVHEGLLMPIDQQVFGQVRAVAANQMGAGRGQKNAEKAAKALLPGLNNAITALEKRIRGTITLMATKI